MQRGQPFLAGGQKPPTPQIQPWLPSLHVISHKTAAFRASFIKFTHARPILWATDMLPGESSFYPMYGLWGMTPDACYAFLLLSLTANTTTGYTNLLLGSRGTGGWRTHALFVSIKWWLGVDCMSLLSLLVLKKLTFKWHCRSGSWGILQTLRKLHRNSTGSHSRCLGHFWAHLVLWPLTFQCVINQTFGTIDNIFKPIQKLNFQKALL